MVKKNSCFQEIYDVARSHGYRVRPGAARKAASASASSSQAPQTADRGEQRVVTAVRDFASATLQVEPGEDSTGFGDQVVDNSVRGCRSGELGTRGALRGGWGLVPIICTTCRDSATANPTKHCASSSRWCGASGRRRTADRHLAFFERRLALEAETRERAAAQGDRRLDLEERRLTFQERDLQQRMCEFQEAQEERRQERAMLLEQNQQLANVLQALADKLKK
ncbi:hypothetical protein MTO96_051060 [Rhipicephalus appendiculatus]